MSAKRSRSAAVGSAVTFLASLKFVDGSDLVPGTELCQLRPKEIASATRPLRTASTLSIPELDNEFFGRGAKTVSLFAVVGLPQFGDRRPALMCADAWSASEC